MKRWIGRILFPLSSPFGQGFIGRTLLGWEPGIDENAHKALLDRPDAPRRWIKTNPAGWFGIDELQQAGGPLVLVEGGFVGTLSADGQQVRVAALACDEERVVALSLVGFDTSIGAVLSRLWSSTAVPFAPASDRQAEWQGPEQLKRSGERYKQCLAHLEGTREVHVLALVRTSHITEGILHPPGMCQN